MVEWEQQNEGAMWPNETTKPEDSIEGICVAIQKGKFGLNYVIDQKDKLTTMKAAKALLARMVKVQIGTMVKIVYKGKKDVGKASPMLVFDVYIAKKQFSKQASE